MAMVGIGLITIVCIPGIPAIHEYACEVVFPIGEGTASGNILGLGSVIAFISGIIFSEVILGETTTQSYTGIIIVCICSAIGVLLVFLTDG